MFNPVYSGASLANLTGKIWREITAGMEDDPTRGAFWLNDMSNPNVGATATANVTGTFLGSTTANTALLDCGATVATQGVNVQYEGPRITPAAGVRFAFECRLKVTDSATGPEFFAGLALTDTTIIAASAVSTTDHLAFSSITDDNVLLFLSEDAGTAVAASASPHTLVEDTYVKLGFTGNGLDGSLLDIYVDGETVTNTTTLDIPAVGLVPSFVCQSGGTTQPIVELDWFAVGYYS